MGILDKIKPTEEKDYSLSKQEIEFLLTLIHDVNFKGKDVEILYNSIYKLQNQYKSKK